MKVILDRPKGSKSKRKRLTGKDEEIQRLLAKKISVSGSSRRLGVLRLAGAARPAGAGRPPQA